MFPLLVNFLRYLSGTSLILAANVALALPSDREQPIQVSADRARFNEKTGIATYTGNVIIIQGSLEIRSDEIVITTDRNGRVLSISAKGNPARLQQKPDPQKGPVMASATRIDYDAKNEIATLTGNARLNQDGASFQGASITLNSQTQQVDAKGDGSNRVQLILPPTLRDNTPLGGKADTRKEKSK